MFRSLVSTEWLRRNLDDPDLIILDGSPVSNISSKTPNHPELQIIDARYFDLKKDFSDSESPWPNMMPTSEKFTTGCQNLGVNTRSKIVIYDNLGIYTGPRIWWMLKKMGHDHVSVLDGGLDAWIYAGGPTEPISRPSYAQGDFVAKLNSRAIVNSSQLLENIETKNFIVLDARSEGRFKAETPEPRVGSRKGHIPGSHNLPYSELVHDGMFLPEEKLKALFEKRELDHRPLVFSCGSGLTACVSLFAASLVLENELKIYDGSWAEWGDGESDLPIH